MRCQVEILQTKAGVSEAWCMFVFCMNQLVQAVRLETITQKLFLDTFLEDQVFINITNDIHFSFVVHLPK